MTGDVVDHWLAELIDRHTRTLSRSEFLKAVRALSARYVERRAELPHRSPLDSAGKRAAFAAFFAPLHFVTMRTIAQHLGAVPAGIHEIVDLGCGTGAASAAWALAFRDRPSLVGVDRHAWALVEAAWNWRTLGIRGRTTRSDLVDAIARPRSGRKSTASALLLAWAANEMDDRSRDALLRALLAEAQNGRAVLVVEPLARRAVPWWGQWARAWERTGGRADEWKDDAALPGALAELSEAAGFRRESIGARTLWLPGTTSG